MYIYICKVDIKINQPDHWHWPVEPQSSTETGEAAIS